MNKQELIDILKRQLKVMPGASGGPYDGGYEYATKHHLAMIADLDEPEKPVVPKYVADMIVEKKQKYGIVDTIKNLGVFNNPFDLIVEKQLNWIVENQEDFAKAWLYGYEVEKEKLYTVEIPNPNGFIHLVLCKDCDGKIFVATFSGGECWKKHGKCKLTETEIKKDFDWAWKFAEVVEEC